MVISLIATAANSYHGIDINFVISVAQLLRKELKRKEQSSQNDLITAKVFKNSTTYVAIGEIKKIPFCGIHHGTHKFKIHC